LKTLVTGGAGFIGSHLVDRLVADGHETWVVDDLSTGREDNLRQALDGGLAHLVPLDITSPDLLALATDVSPDVILHLAAQMDVRKSVADPLHDTKTNVVGTVNVLTAAVQSDTRKVVFASSGGTVYGEPESLPVREDAPLRPTSPYGAAVLDSSRLTTATGWTARMPLEDGLAATVTWIATTQAEAAGACR